MAVCPMFPLGSVLVPGMVLPLHVFEPRYRQLVLDCLTGTPEFGVTLIERGSEVGGGEVRTDVGCLARVLDAEPLPDGRWAVVALGTTRLRVQRWLPDAPYPRAEIELDDDLTPASVDDVLDDVFRRLRQVLALSVEVGDPVAPATFDRLEDPVLASYQAVALSPLGTSDRQVLLAARSVEGRLAALADMLDEQEQVLRFRLGGPAGAASD